MGSCTSQPLDEVEADAESGQQSAVPGADVRADHPNQNPQASTSKPKGKGWWRGRSQPTPADQPLDTVTRRIHENTQKLIEKGYRKGSLVNEEGCVEIKTLLLGSGESGKSTILKQMKILHGDGFTRTEMMQYRTIVRHNLVDSGQTLLRVVLQWGYEPDLGNLLPHGEAGVPTKDVPPSVPSVEADSEDLRGLNRLPPVAYDVDEEDEEGRETETEEDGQITFEEMIRPASDEGEGDGTSKASQKQTHRGANGTQKTNTSSQQTYPPSSSPISVPLSPTVRALLDYELLPGREVPMWVGQAIYQLWTGQPFMRDVLRRSNEFYLMDNAPYFFKHAARICDPKYWPTTDDVLRCRVQTRGVIQSSFIADGAKINMYDVGGQRAERQKWIVAFENVKCVIFTASLSEYDQTLLENPGKNRLNESLELFKNVINSRWLQHTAIVLLFNKMDVFQEKYWRSPISRYFPEYAGTTVESGVNFIRWKYHLMNTNRVPIFEQFTTATDTERCHLVLAAVRDRILQRAIEQSGLI